MVPSIIWNHIISKLKSVKQFYIIAKEAVDSHNPSGGCAQDGENMDDKKVLLDNIDKIHTTELGVTRIKKNLNLDTDDVAAYCRHKILSQNCNIYRQGKNWYCEVDSMKITVNAHSYTIITAHIIP